MHVNGIGAENARWKYRDTAPLAESGFQSAMEQAVHDTGGFVPTGTQQVVDAWKAAKAETGIDPLPMNRLSTAMVLHVEDGRQGPFSAFLGSSAASAAQMAERILHRLAHPTRPVRDAQFARDELVFYRCFLEKLL